MAQQLSGTAGQVSSQAGGMTGAPLGTLTGALQGGLTNFFDMGKGYLDKFFPPEKREDLKQKLTKFATERPKLAAFLLSQVALSGIPLALFFVMSLTVLVFALIAGILVGVVGAVLFTVFCLGLALLVLLPTLFITTFAAAFIFLWGLGAYYIVKWFNDKDIPGIHTSASSAVDGAKSQLGLDSLPALNGLSGGGGSGGGDADQAPPPHPRRKTPGRAVIASRPSRSLQILRRSLAVGKAQGRTTVQWAMLRKPRVDWPVGLHLASRHE